MPCTYVINDLKGEETVGTLYKEELEKTNQKSFRNEKLIKKEDNNLYIKWKGYNDLFNSWIVKKRHNINEWVNVFQNQNI